VSLAFEPFSEYKQPDAKFKRKTLSASNISLTDFSAIKNKLLKEAEQVKSAHDIGLQLDVLARTEVPSCLTVDKNVNRFKDLIHFMSHNVIRKHQKAVSPMTDVMIETISNVDTRIFTDVNVVLQKVRSVAI
jgi:hypothetical protein